MAYTNTAWQPVPIGDEKAFQPFKAMLQRVSCHAMAFCYFIQGSRALHLRSHTTATGSACSGDSATSS